MEILYCVIVLFNIVITFLLGKMMIGNKDIDNFFLTLVMIIMAFFTFLPYINYIYMLFGGIYVTLMKFRKER